MKIIDKYAKLGIIQTPILVPVVTTDFYEDCGVKINIGGEMRPLKKYLFTTQFSDTPEYEDFMNKINEQLKN